MLIPGVGPLRRRYQDRDDLGMRQQGMSPLGHRLPIEVRGTLLEHKPRGTQLRGHRGTGVGQRLRGEEVHVPVQAPVVVVPIEELHLLEGITTVNVARHAAVHREECVQGGGAGLLRTDHQELGQRVAVFGLRPDLLVPHIVAGIAPDGVHLLGVQAEVHLGQLNGRRRGQLEVGPALQELDHRLECVQSQPIRSIVGHVRHEDVDGIIDDCLEELTALDALVQLVPAPRIPVYVHGVGEQATRLPWQHHYVPMDEAPTQASWSQVRILLRRGHLDVPHLLPGQVEQLVGGIHARVMRRYGVARVCGYIVIQGEGVVQLHFGHQERQVVVQMRLLVLPHVREPVELLDILQQKVIAQILLPRPMMIVLPREAQIESESRHHGCYILLGGY